MEKRIKHVEEEKRKYIEFLEKVNLENDMTTQDLSLIVKKKEDVLV